MRYDLPTSDDSNVIEISLSNIGKTRSIRKHIFLAHFYQTSFLSDDITFVATIGVPCLSLT